MNPTLGNAANDTINAGPALGTSLLQAVAALLIVIGLIFMTAWLLRRFAFGGQLGGRSGRGQGWKFGQPKPGRNLAITESLWIDARHRIVTVSDSTNTARRYTILIGPQSMLELSPQQALQSTEKPAGSAHVSFPQTGI